MPALASEANLGALAARFEEAERRVRALIAQAPNGNRRELLTEALQILNGLRQAVADDAGLAVEAAYALAVGAIQQLQGRRVELPDGAPVTRMGAGLAKALSDAATTAADGSRQAFRAVTADTLDDAAQTAVAGLITRTGQRISIATQADRHTATVGRRATMIGLRDGLGPAGRVTIHGASDDPVCSSHVGHTVPAGTALPPYHIGCQCSASPDGYTPDALQEAMEEARKDNYVRWYRARHERRRAA